MTQILLNGLRRFRIFRAIFILIVAAGCGAKAADFTRVNGDVLEVDGPMDEPLLAELRQQSWTTIRAIRFRSEGGMPEPGLEIARLLESTGKPIIMHDVCGSACFDVLVIRGRVTLEPGTVVLLHNNPIGQHVTVVNNYPNISRALERLAKNESAWLKVNGVNKDLLVLAKLMTGPMCVFSPEDSEASLPKLLTLAHFEAWAPRSETLRQFGVVLPSTWQQNAASVAEAMNARYPLANPAKLRRGDEPTFVSLPKAGELSSVLAKIPICAQTQAQRP
jgi:hypothetical protein